MRDDDSNRDDDGEVRPLHIICAVVVLLFMFAALVVWVISEVK